MKFTKIVCTIWLKTEKKEYLSALMDAGMNMMRLNFSHGDFEEHGARIKTLKELMKEKNKHVAILLDTPGPEIRTGKIKDKSCFLELWSQFVLTVEEVLWDSEKVFVTYDGLSADVMIWDTILLDDGLISLKVKSFRGRDVVCEVMASWTLTAKRWVNLPGIRVSLPDLTDDDIKDIIWGCEQWVDYVAASFVRNWAVVEKIRNILKENNSSYIKIISKIENQEGIDNFEEILEASDGIMVARWDMWTEIPLYEVPLVQKMMIKRANDEWKIVITATEMLESMITKPRPTRAEVTDIANAVFDGTDAVMLSGETAKHNCKYPVEAVLNMASICERVDLELDGTQFDVKSKFVDAHIEEQFDFTEAVAKWAVETSMLLDAKLIVATTKYGRTVRKIRKYFPGCPILAITSESYTARQLMLVRGVVDAEILDLKTDETLYDDIRKIVLKKGLVESGDVIVVVGWQYVEKEEMTNTLKMLKV